MRQSNQNNFELTPMASAISAMNFKSDSNRASPVLREKRRFPVYVNSWYDYFVLILLLINRTTM